MDRSNIRPNNIKQVYAVLFFFFFQPWSTQAEKTTSNFTKQISQSRIYRQIQTVLQLFWDDEIRKKTEALAPSRLERQDPNFSVPAGEDTIHRD